MHFWADHTEMSTLSPNPQEATTAHRNDVLSHDCSEEKLLQCKCKRRREGCSDASFLPAATLSFRFRLKSVYLQRI